LHKKLKNKNLKFLIGLILLVTLNFAFLPSFHTPMKKSESDLNELKSSGVYYDIDIDDLPGSLNNWTWATTQPWFGGGSGTELDPYIIEDDTFTYSSGAGEPLRIFNSRKHFIVRNCTIINSHPSWAGVHLNNVTNGDFFDNQIVFNAYGIVYIDVNDTIISNNNISVYTDYGVWFIGDCDNNIVTGNIVNGNGGDYGIAAEAGADNNLIFNNYVMNHAVNNAYDDGANNNWNNTVTGNYWDNYTGYDMDLDGIGDDPHGIAGIAGNFDYLPIWNLQSPIGIDDLPSSLNNWTWAMTQPWFGGGSGTELDPFILRDLNINGTGTGNCLAIENSRQYFVIQECTLFNSGTSLTDAGIYLSNVTNGVIIDNICSDNYNGIFFGNSHNNDFTSNVITDNPYVGIWGRYDNENNTIYDNFITNTRWAIAIEHGDNNILQNNVITGLISDDGILLYGSGNDCVIDNNYVSSGGNNGIRLESYSNCIISRNTIRDCPTYGLNFNFADNSLVFENRFINNSDHAVDNGANNDWNNTLIGNYWDDYTGYDMDFDGIGDIPYDVPPTGGSQDYLPIWDLQEPIAIDDLPGSLNNWTWAASQAWCSGSGTELDPYVIENMNIDANLTDSCISILNSKVHFIIASCNLNNSVLSGTDGGIYLYNVTNGNIIGNHFYNNRNAAIYGPMVNSTTIIDNFLNSNRHGIYMLGSYNEIYDNDIYGDATGTGIVIEGSYVGNLINENTVENCWQGIWLNTVDNNTLLGNDASKNMRNGFVILGGSNFNSLSGNIAELNALSGIYIDNSNNITIENTLTADNMQHGIYINNGDDNIIHGNEIRDNVMDGINVATGSSSNLIYRNFFWGNGRHAFDNGAFTDWNSTTIGNYWDNHTGPDTSPKDGIVDNPYTYIGGSAGSIDYLPIAEEGSPSIIINSPIADDVFGVTAPSFSVSITDTFLNEMWYTIDGGLHNYTFTESTGTIDQFAWDSMPNGVITLTFYASDLPGNLGFAEVNIEKDTHAPLIVISSPHTDDTFGANAPSFTVEISDDNLDSMWYSLDGGTTNFLFATNGTINQAAWAALSEGSVTITFYANDTLGNLASETVNIEKDSQAPLIVISSPNADDIFGANAPSFTVEISDDNLDSMWYSLDGGTTNFLFATNGTINQAAWAALVEGSVTITFYANDTAGNLEFETVNIEKDSQAPLIVISSPNADDTFGASAPSFTVEISDDNLDSMWYSLDGGTTNFLFTANGTINQAAWAALVEGSVTITFYANDTAGNLEFESVDIVKSLPPPDDNFVVIIIIVVSIVAGVAIVTVVLLLRRRKARIEV